MRVNRVALGMGHNVGVELRCHLIRRKIGKAGRILTLLECIRQHRLRIKTTAITADDGEWYCAIQFAEFACHGVTRQPASDNNNWCHDTSPFSGDDGWCALIPRLTPS